MHCTIIIDLSLILILFLKSFVNTRPYVYTSAVMHLIPFYFSIASNLLSTLSLSCQYKRDFSESRGCISLSNYKVKYSKTNKQPRNRAVYYMRVVRVPLFIIRHAVQQGRYGCLGMNSSNWQSNIRLLSLILVRVVSSDGPG